MAFAIFPVKPDHVAGSAAPAIMVGLFVAFGGILFGYDTGCINGILGMDQFRHQFSTGYIDPIDGGPNINPTQSSEIVSILSAGTFFGALGAAPLADLWGRRPCLILAVAIFSLGVILQIVATDLSMLVGGRFVAGLGVGDLSLLVPLYQSEMAPKWIRGTLVCAYQLAITFGLLVAGIVNNCTSGIASSASYRIPIGLQFVWAAILLMGLSVLPETPRYLIKRGLHTKAASSLSRLRRLDITHPALTEELAEIEANHAYELSLGPSTYRDVFLGSPHLGRRLLTGCGLQMLQQLSGCNFIFYYSTTYFQNSGIKSAFIIALTTNIVNFVSTLPGMILVEAWGRRPILLAGALGMAVSQLVVASVGTSYGHLESANVGVIVFLCLYIFFFAASWGPVTWVVTSEIFPLKVRAKSMSITTASNWLVNWAIAYASPYLVNAGPGYADLKSKVFFIWGACCLLGFAFVYFMVYETAKISLEQIDELYERVDKAWKSAGFNPTWSFQDIQDGNEAGAAASSGIQLGENTENAEQTTHSEQRQRAGTAGSGSDGGESGLTSDSTAHGSSSVQTDEDKIVAQLGDVDLSY